MKKKIPPNSCKYYCSNRAFLCMNNLKSKNDLIFIHADHPKKNFINEEKKDKYFFTLDSG